MMMVWFWKISRDFKVLYISDVKGTSGMEVITYGGNLKKAFTEF